MAWVTVSYAPPASGMVVVPVRSVPVTVVVPAASSAGAPAANGGAGTPEEKTIESDPVVPDPTSVPVQSVAPVGVVVAPSLEEPQAAADVSVTASAMRIETFMVFPSV